MNDQLKDFVNSHREAFDDLTPPPLNLQDLKKRISEAEKVERPTIISVFARWSPWMAAALFVIALGGWWLVQPAKEDFAPSLVQTLQPNPDVQKTIAPPTTTAVKVVATKQTNVKSRSLSVVNSLNADFYEQLSDSTSSSQRLSAILELGKSGIMDNRLLAQLARTISDDGNSNVRLAALNLMSQYREDSYVSQLLVQSLDQQKDPLVLLELIAVLGKMEKIDIHDRLYALANDPATFAAVKDEAYQLLLKEEKL